MRKFLAALLLIAFGGIAFAQQQYTDPPIGETVFTPFPMPMCMSFEAISQFHLEEFTDEGECVVINDGVPFNTIFIHPETPLVQMPDGGMALAHYFWVNIPTVGYRWLSLYEMAVELTPSI